MLQTWQIPNDNLSAMFYPCMRRQIPCIVLRDTYMQITDSTIPAK
jgi:hypothetical protein